jgi:hypothetical protein
MAMKMPFGKKPKAKPAEPEGMYPTGTAPMAPEHEEIKAATGYDEPEPAQYGVPKYQEPPEGQPLKEPLEGARAPPMEENPFGEPPAPYAEPPPPFVQPAPVEPQAPPTEDMQNIAQSVGEGVKQELNAKIDVLREEVNELKSLEKDISELVSSMKEVERKYEELETKAPERMAEISEIKGTVNSMNQVLNKALPALIKEISSLKK